MTTAAIAFGGSAVNYGCDASGTNDNLATINAALVALSGTGGVLYFGAGTFKVSAAITNTGSVPILIGTGATFTGSGASSITGVAIAWPYSASGGFTAGADLAGTATDQYVVNISGGSTPGAVSITATALAWAAAVTTPTISQTTPASDVATNNMVFAPQAPYASASTHKTPGSFVVNLATPVSGGSEAAFEIQRAGTFLGSIGHGPFSGNFVGAWFGLGVTPGVGNYSFLGDGATVTILNAPSGGNVDLRINNASFAQLGVANTDFLGLGSTPAATGMLRLPNLNTDSNAVIKARNAANNADRAIVKLDSADELTWGDFGNSANIFQTAAGFYWQIASSNTANLQAAALTLSAGVSLIGTGTFLIDTTTGALTLDLGTSNATTINIGIQAGGTSAISMVATGTTISATGGGILQVTGAGVRIDGPLGGYPGLSPFTLAVEGTPVDVSAATVTLNSTQYANPIIILSGTVNAMNCIITLPNVVGAFWIFDFNLVSFGIHDIIFTTGSGIVVATITASSLRSGSLGVIIYIPISNAVSSIVG